MKTQNTEAVLHPTALQWWGRQPEHMPLRWMVATGATGDNRGNRDGWKVNIRACPIQVMADLFLRYLRFLLFNPKPMNQQEGKERTEGDEATLRDAIATITP